MEGKRAADLTGEKKERKKKFVDSKQGNSNQQRGSRSACARGNHRSTTTEHVNQTLMVQAVDEYNKYKRREKKKLRNGNRKKKGNGR